MSIIRIKHWQDEALMQDIIEDISSRNLPSIGIFESRYLRREKKYQMTSLAIQPEDLHAAVFSAGNNLELTFYRDSGPGLELEVLDTWIVTPETDRTDMMKQINFHAQATIRELSALIARWFFHERGAFGDASFVEKWDTVYYPEFKNTGEGAASYLQQLEKQAKLKA